MVPSCFVDDLSAEMTGPDDHVLKELAGFVRHVANSFTEAEVELSKPRACAQLPRKLLAKDWRNS